MQKKQDPFRKWARITAIIICFGLMGLGFVLNYTRFTRMNQPPSLEQPFPKSPGDAPRIDAPKSSK